MAVLETTWESNCLSYQSWLFFLNRTVFCTTGRRWLGEYRNREQRGGSAGRLCKSHCSLMQVVRPLELGEVDNCVVSRTVRIKWMNGWLFASTTGWGCKEWVSGWMNEWPYSTRCSVLLSLSSPFSLPLSFVGDRRNRSCQMSRRGDEEEIRAKEGQPAWSGWIPGEALIASRGL